MNASGNKAERTAIAEALEGKVADMGKMSTATSSKGKGRGKGDRKGKKDHRGLDFKRLYNPKPETLNHQTPKP